MSFYAALVFRKKTSDGRLFWMNDWTKYVTVPVDVVYLSVRNDYK